jgi:hypothetical protein
VEISSCLWARSPQRRAAPAPAATPSLPQVFFSWQHCPLLQQGLPFAQRLWYTYGTWSYFCTIATVPTFIVVPFVSLALGVHPVMIDLPMAVAGSCYFASCFLVQSYVRDFSHWISLWFVGVSR